MNSIGRQTAGKDAGSVRKAKPVTSNLMAPRRDRRPIRTISPTWTLLRGSSGELVRSGRPERGCSLPGRPGVLSGSPTGGAAMATTVH